MDLSVIIVSYNVKYFLEHCLLSVIKACSGIEAEILVADNHSADGSREYLEPKFPGVQFFWGKENNGFGRANNNMLQKAKGNYILFLNPDTIVPEDCFTACIHFFKTHTDCGALGVKMVDGSGNFLPESKRTIPNAGSGFFKITGLANIFPRSKVFAGYYANRIAENETGKADIIAGAFMMISREAAEKTKGFDEDFFLYGEDIDLSYRIIKSGFKNYYYGRMTIIHFKGESTQKNDPAYNHRFYGAMKMFSDKHFGKNIFRDIAIAVGKNTAALKKTFSASQKNRSKKDNTLFCEGDTNEKIIAVLKKNNYRVLPAGENKNPAANIIFCEGTLSNKMIIEMLQLIPADTGVLFHESDAESIISSSDKNKQGLAIAMS